MVVRNFSQFVVPWILGVQGCSERGVDFDGGDSDEKRGTEESTRDGEQ